MAPREPDYKNFVTRGLIQVEHATVGKEEYQAHPAPSPKRQGPTTLPYQKTVKGKKQKPQRDLYDYTKATSTDPDKDSPASRQAEALREAHIQDLKNRNLHK